MYSTVVKGPVAYLAWVTTSYLCHLSTKCFLTTSQRHVPWIPGLVWACLATSSQMGLCLLMMKQAVQNNAPTSGVRRHLPALGHLVGTLCSNCSMTFLEASSTIAIRLMEPITTALLDALVYRTSLPVSVQTSLPLVVIGCIIFSGQSFKNIDHLSGIIFALMSNLGFGLRNIAIKNKGECEIKVRSRHALIFGFLAWTSVAILDIHKLGPGMHVVFLLSSSTEFHVLYSSLSTCVVLKEVSVITHAVLNNLKRLLVVMFLVLAGSRSLSLSNLGGLTLAVLGLGIYTMGKDTSTGLRVEKGLKYRKQILFLLLALSCGVYTTLSLSVQPDKREPYEKLKINTSHWMSVLNRLDNITHVRPNKQPSPKAFRTYQKWNLVDHPNKTDFYLPFLNKNNDLITEMQRVQVNIFQTLLRNYKYAFLFDINAFENKGDPAITVGEVYLLRRLGIHLVFYCNTCVCEESGVLDKALSLSRNYSRENTVVLLHGGGNLIGYLQNDVLRDQILSRFYQHFNILMFPQSIWLKGGHLPAHRMVYVKEIYQKYPNITFLLRDRKSFAIGRELFPRQTLFLVPDIVFQIGSIPRFMSPIYDILWLRRADDETPNYTIPSLMGPYTVHVADWTSFISPKGETSMENAFLHTSTGAMFLQRGRVVITDRLHGHILSTLCGIPHVMLDNPARKLTSFHETWTKGLTTALMAKSSEQALKLAVDILEKRNHSLPGLIAYNDVREHLP
ncbi:uncharacterized protein LOC124127619 [Haliotis rufescens]|uniref:uncharacterized protein LOC124127619 n=1 Tax=Haliotis rufescens TaxID=6454 RepID=UPI00201F2D5B|nr:uncharacterized protein LOC124127619 [Haliotis rufescens]